MSLASTTSIGIMWSWMGDADTAIVLDLGETLHRDRYASSPTVYFPASDFTHSGISGHLRYSVTADLVDSSGAVPEPATIWLTAMACFGLAFPRVRANAPRR